MTAQSNPIDMAIVRQWLEQVAELTLQRNEERHPSPPPKADIPAPLKWAAAIISALMTAGVVALTFWMVSTLNNLQLTVARIDERQQSQVNDVTDRFQQIDQRLSRLEELQRQERGK